jgi:serine/threonine protein kinase
VLRDADEPPLSGHAAPTLAQVAAAFPQFEILSLIGRGGMGSVFKIRQPGLDRVVALKILCPELGRDPAFAERFAREARVLAKLNHPNIVTVFEHGETGGFFYLLMEYVDGVNLRQAMRAGRFTPEQALAVVPGICDALQAAHAQGVWHRDIKPENILLDAQGAVKIVDFGIARLIGDPARDFTLTRTGAALGSAPYMAPEQHEKPHEVDHRADIYSLGVVIYEMLTGELPLGRFPAPSQRAAVSARIDEIVFQTLEKERELRQQSANEVKTDVHRAMRPEVGEPAPHAKPHASRKGMGALAFGMFLVATVITPVLWLYYARNEVVFIGILSLLSALGLALMSWREPLGKFVTIATGVLLMVLVALLLLRPVSPRDRVSRPQPPTAHTPADDFSTPRNAVESLIKAAKQKDAEGFKRGIAAKLLAKTLAEAPDLADPMRDFGKLSYADLVSQDRDAAMVRLNRDGHPNEFPMVRENAEWKLDLPKPVAASPQPSQTSMRPRVPQPNPPAPSELTAEEVFRKMVAAANASDGEEFVKHEYRSSIMIPGGSPAPVASRMAPFFGEILLAKPLPPRHNDSKDSARLIARIKARDGRIIYREFQFTIRNGQWKYITDGLPQYRASCRIEFHPDQGKAEPILKLHLGQTPFTAVPGADGQFDISGEDLSADAAAQTADHNANQLLESLKKAGLDPFFKIIQRAKTPETPWLGEDPSPAETPTP